MGEYAKRSGEQVKIGTCEDMYYLRYGQRHDVTPERGSVNPVKDAPALRFRFPWPDEDGTPPGGIGFEDYDRSLHVRGLSMPDGVEHGNVQFKARAGYLVSLTCPESGQYDGDNMSATHKSGEYRVARNGFGGAVHLVRQKLIPGIGVVPILRCGGCGAMWREESRDEIEAIADAIRAEGDKREREGGTGNGSWHHEVARRVLAGITALEQA